MLSFGLLFSNRLNMNDFLVQYEGTKFSFTVYPENMDSLSYEFLIRQESNDPKWKWIYLPYGEKTIKVEDWIIPCEPVPSFNTDNGIELSFDAVLDKHNYTIKAVGEFQNKHFSDRFVASVFKETIQAIINDKSIVLGEVKTIDFVPDDNNGEKISITITSSPH